jgi:hypothetical protein
VGREREGNRERLVIASATKWSEAIQAEAPIWIASAFALMRFGGLKPAVARRASEGGSSLSLLAMTIAKGILRER